MKPRQRDGRQRRHHDQDDGQLDDSTSPVIWHAEFIANSAAGPSPFLSLS
jgi:hypothetical protein